MEYQRFDNTIVLRLDVGEEIIASMEKLAKAENIRLASVMGLGAAKELTVGALDPETKEYRRSTFTGLYEITSLVGTINTFNGEFYTHLHMNAASAGGAAVGGHLNSAVIGATAEIVVTVIPGTVDRRKDPDVGLNIFSFENGTVL